MSSTPPHTSDLMSPYSQGHPVAGPSITHLRVFPDLQKARRKYGGTKSSGSWSINTPAPSPHWEHSSRSPEVPPAGTAVVRHDNRFTCPVGAAFPSLSHCPTPRQVLSRIISQTNHLPLNRYLYETQTKPSPTPGWFPVSPSLSPVLPAPNPVVTLRLAPGTVSPTEAEPCIPSHCVSLEPGTGPGTQSTLDNCVSSG